MISMGCFRNDRVGVANTQHMVDSQAVGVPGIDIDTPGDKTGFTAQAAKSCQCLSASFPRPSHHDCLCPREHVVLTRALMLSISRNVRTLLITLKTRALVPRKLLTAAPAIPTASYLSRLAECPLPKDASSHNHSTASPMPSSNPPTDLPYHSFPDSASFTTFLDANHTTLPAFYLQLAKKASGIPSITSAEAVEVALCYGWIDGWGRGIDDTWHIVRYTPRRPKSVWSKRNVETVGRLIEEGRMREAGLARVNEAKADGRWERAYGGKEMTVEPDDLLAVLGEEGNERAKRVWEGCKRGEKYVVLYRIRTASEKARKGVIQRVVASLREGVVPGTGERQKYGNKGTKKKTTGTIQKKVEMDDVDEVRPSPKTKRKPVASSTKVVRSGVEKSSVSRRPGLRARSVRSG